jgi:hypothetical protein
MVPIKTKTNYLLICSWVLGTQEHLKSFSGLKRATMKGAVNASTAIAEIKSGDACLCLDKQHRNTWQPAYVIKSKVDDTKFIRISWIGWEEKYEVEIDRKDADKNILCTHSNPSQFKYDHIAHVFDPWISDFQAREKQYSPLSGAIPPCSQIVEIYGNMLKEQKFTDLHIVCGDEIVLKAHRIVVFTVQPALEQLCKEGKECAKADQKQNMRSPQSLDDDDSLAEAIALSKSNDTKDQANVFSKTIDPKSNVSQDTAAHAVLYMRSIPSDVMQMILHFMYTGVFPINRSSTNLNVSTILSYSQAALSMHVVPLVDILLNELPVINTFQEYRQLLSFAAIIKSYNKMETTKQLGVLRKHAVKTITANPEFLF